MPEHLEIPVEEVHEEYPMSDADIHLVNEINSELQPETTTCEEGTSQQRITKIQRVPEIMKQVQGNSNEYYTPREIAIGPLHAVPGNNLEKKVLKHRLAASFINNSGCTGETLLGKIKNNINEIMERFDGTAINYDLSNTTEREKWARMMFLDGCAILQFICSIVSGDLLKFNISSGQAAIIQQDLFLLENQIPFRVLVLLMQLSPKKIEFVNNIYLFILMNAMAPVDKKSWGRYERNRIGEEENQVQLFVGKEPVHLLDLLRSEILFDDGFKRESRRSSDLFSDYKWSFRNVQDLKTVGITLKPSYTSGLRSVSFTTRFFIFCQLKLPPLIVDHSTASKLLNLVAYEMCPDNYTTNYGVTSYLSFLDSLIDSEQDVKDLRSAHILRNRLSSDAEVAQLFNSIGSNLVLDDTYSEVKNKIQNHYDRTEAVWMAQFFNEHLRNPWTILALLAAIVALLLTGIQTHYAIHPKS